jgi:hypothetical protein
MSIWKSVTMADGGRYHDHWSPALHIFLGTRNEGISRRLTCGVVDVQRFLHAYERSLACDSCLWIYLHFRFHEEHPLVLLYFSNPGAYIPSPLTPCELWIKCHHHPYTGDTWRTTWCNRPSTRSGYILCTEVDIEHDWRMQKKSGTDQYERHILW